MLGEALVLSLRHMPPNHVLALQLTAGVLNFVSHLHRRSLENRHPEVAARGFHAMSEQQWNGLDAAQREPLLREADKHSRTVTNLQLTASSVQMAISLAAVSSGDPRLAETPARMLAADLTTVVFATLQEMVQASFGLVGADRPTHGISGAHMRSSAAFFAVMAAGTSYGAEYFGSLVPSAERASEVLRGEGRSEGMGEARGEVRREGIGEVSGGAVRGEGVEEAAMTRSEAWQARAGVAAVKAAMSFLLYGSDMVYASREEAKQAGAEERWDPRLTMLHPLEHDYSRIKDQVPTRLALLNGGQAVEALVAFALRDAPESARAAAGSFVSAAYEGSVYRTIGGTWQAQGEVRLHAAELRSSRGQEGAGDVEMGHAGPQPSQAIDATRTNSWRLHSASSSESGD